MPSQKISELETLTNPHGTDLISVVDDVQGTPTNKNMPLNTLFGKIPANTGITGTLTVSGDTNLEVVTANTLHVSGVSTMAGVTITSNGLIVQKTLTPANSSVSSIPTGKIFFDSNYLYIKVANNTIKRVSLSSF